MTVTIFGASGQVGKQLIIHALSKGWSVRAFGRQIDQWLSDEQYKSKFLALKGYVFDAGDVKKAISGADAVLSALGGAMDGSDKTRSLGLKNIVTQMEKYGPKRIVALGGLGVLDSSEGEGPLFLQDDYPKEYVPVGQEHYAAFQYLKTSSLDWTFFCAPNLIEEDADGKFTMLAEQPSEKWEIKTGNLAIAMIQSVEKDLFLRQRVGISDN